MNAIGPEQTILDSFKVALAAAYPARVTTRSLQDFADRTKAELDAGIYTIIANGQPAGEIYFQTFRMIVVGQIQFPEKTAGELIENAEFAMAREIKNLLQRKLRGPDMRVTGVDQSSQLEVPYGWVSVGIEVGPYDGTEPLTANEGIGRLADFLTFRADIDIKPQETLAEHNKWVKDAPDYTTSKPDAQLNVTIPRSPP